MASPASIHSTAHLRTCPTCGNTANTAGLVTAYCTTLAYLTKVKRTDIVGTFSSQTTKRLLNGVLSAIRCTIQSHMTHKPCTIHQSTLTHTTETRLFMNVNTIFGCWLIIPPPAGGPPCGRVWIRQPVTHMAETRLCRPVKKLSPHYVSCAGGLRGRVARAGCKGGL